MAADRCYCCNRKLRTKQEQGKHYCELCQGPGIEHIPCANTYRPEREKNGR
jgi:hypothetical protein